MLANISNREQTPPVEREYVVNPDRGLLPVLRGQTYRHEDRTLRIRVWCPNCDSFHVHGWEVALPADRLEHRSAHCANNRYGQGGYLIGVELPPWEGPSEWDR